MIQTLRDIYRNILHIYYVGYIQLLPKHLQNQILQQGFFSRWSFYLSYILRYVSNWIKATIKKETPNFHKAQLKGNVWFFANTKNQHHALKTVYDGLPNGVWVSRSFRPAGEKFILLSGLKRFLYLLKFRSIAKALKQEAPEKTKNYLAKVFEAAGQYEYLQKLLKRYHPKAVVISNDHGITSRSLLLAAKSLKIPTIYIQHATVSEYFPNLEADLNLLEGQQALNKYKACGPLNGKVEFIGMPKFDAYVAYRNFGEVVKEIGLCFNPADQLSIIQEVTHTLAEQFPDINFTYRKHPRDNRDLGLRELPNLNQSDSHQENSFAFLIHRDMIIAGDTSIHLEATLLNIPGVYYSFTGSNKMRDYYGFIADGLIKEANNLENLKQWVAKYMKKKPEVYTKASYYNDVVGKAEEGKSIELAIHYINELIST